ncbi:MAG: metal-dependent transcriptional regulator [Desulfarculaceae bacterium]|nr:metal-dependent transcriptional regulator [Desulfarculaceae bacterium]
MSQATSRRLKGKRLTAQSEDYLEAIAELQKENQVARTKDIAERLGVTPGTVTSALKSLGDKGLVNYQPYSPISLTASGERLAGEIIRRHDTLTRFLGEVLGVPPSQAEDNACRAEHVLGREVIERMACFLEFLDSFPRSNQAWRDEYARFCESTGQECRALEEPA